MTDCTISSRTLDVVRRSFKSMSALWASNPLCAKKQWFGCATMLCFLTLALMTQRGDRQERPKA
eukprot:4468124-Amphidinium_carterae.1